MAESTLFEGTLDWLGQPAGQAFDYDHFNRDTEIRFGPALFEGSGTASFNGDESKGNPETLMMASLMQCHFLTFMAIASRSRVVITGYQDHASGLLGVRDGKTRMLEVTLHPKVQLADPAQAPRLPAIHEKAHANCFMANSVNFPVVVKPVSA